MGFGDGSFREYGNGYRFELYYTCKIDGKTHRLSTTGNTKKECRAKMDVKKAKVEEEAKKHRGYSAESQNVQLQNAIADWLKTYKLGTVKMSTYDRNERSIDNHIKGTTFGHKQAIQITSKDISKFLDKLLDDNSESSVKKVYELLNQFYAWFYAKDPASNPMREVDPPRAKKNLGEIEIDTGEEMMLEDMVLSDDEIKQFKKQCFLPYKNGALGRPKHGPDLYFMLVTAIRFGEAAALVWGDIDMENRVMIIRRNQSVVKNRDGSDNSKTRRILTTPKSGKAREVMLSKDALEALAEIKKRSHHTDDKDFVICSDSGKSLTNHNLRDALDGIMKATGLNTGRRAEKFGLHYLRHTGISYYIRHGIPLEMVSKMAGHSSVAITERIYYHIIHDQQAKMLEMMDGIN